jgi:hypothetical protein
MLPQDLWTTSLNQDSHLQTDGVILYCLNSNSYIFDLYVC